MYISYRSPWWLSGQHLQTIYPATWMPVPNVSYRHEKWSTPDEDFIELDWVDGPATKPLVILFHGLEGSSNSHYAKRIMSAVQQRGWRGVVVHFRGCGGSVNLLPRSYHCGDSAEIDWILKRFRQKEHGDIFALGVSLGGNACYRTTLRTWLLVEFFSFPTDQPT